MCGEMVCASRCCVGGGQGVVVSLVEAKVLQESLPQIEEMVG